MSVFNMSYSDVLNTPIALMSMLIYDNNVDHEVTEKDDKTRDNSKKKVGTHEDMIKLLNS